MSAARAADTLDEALDLLVAGRPVIVSGNLSPLVGTAHAAREAFALEVPPIVAARHLAALGITSVSPLERGRSRRRHRVAVVLIAATLGLLLMGGAAVAASGSALPGQALYPVKKAVEKIELAFTNSPSSRAKLHLEFARRRLDELSALLEKRRNGEDVNIGAAMSSYKDEVADVEDAVAADALGQDYAALLAKVQGELAKHVDVLTQLQSQVPAQAQDAIANAIARAQNAQDNVMHGRSGDHGKPGGTPGGPPSVNPGKSQSHR
jgi:hypothetical protein